MEKGTEAKVDRRRRRFGPLESWYWIALWGAVPAYFVAKWYVWLFETIARMD